MRRAWIAGATLGAVLLTAAGCDWGNSEGAQDAPVAKRDDSGATVQNMPDTFGNIAYKCLGNTGYLVVMVTHNINDTPPMLVPHKMCPGFTPDLRSFGPAPATTKIVKEEG